MKIASKRGRGLGRFDYYCGEGYMGGLWSSTNMNNEKNALAFLTGNVVRVKKRIVDTLQVKTFNRL